MKIQYKFVNGDVTEVEVNDEIGTFIVDSRREEENANRKSRYHNYSIDGMEYEGDEFGYFDDNLPELEEERRHMREALSALTDIQLHRFIRFANGKSIRQIAREDGVDHKVVRLSIEASRKKLKKFF